jgi:ADP-ribosylglycohydrolase
LKPESESGARRALARTSGSFGQGWVGDEALAVGLHAAATAGSFSEAIEVAANHDGDSDSTASIAGQLYGAKHGLAALPNDAVYRLDVIEALLEMFGEWAQLSSQEATR